MIDTQPPELEEQIGILSKQLDGPFPYADCRAILQQARDEGAGGEQSLKSFIPDLNSYFYLVESHASGVEHVLQWDGSRLVQSKTMLRRSFFQAHTKYRPLEWRINQVNTPELHRHIVVSDQLRLLLTELIDRLLESERRMNSARQDEYLLSPA